MFLRTNYRVNLQRHQELRSPAGGKFPGSRKTAFWPVHPAIVYGVGLVMLGTSLCFALVGLSVAAESEAYRHFSWVPRLLAILSGFLIATTLGRLIGRGFRYGRNHRRDLQPADERAL
jgi:hypothetical protein